MKKSIVLTMWLLLGLAHAEVRAANGGKLDSSSLGAIQISLEVVPSLQIDTVTDVNLNIMDRSVDAHFAESFCVTGRTGGRYTVTAYGSGSDVRFVLGNPEGGQLEYELGYRGDSRSDTYDILSPGLPSASYEAFANKSECENTAFQIIFRSNNLRPANPGRYSGYLTMIVSPM